MRYYIIAGEASGDLHGSNLIKSLKKFDRKAKFRAWGGNLMKSAGAEIVKHYKDLAFMGFWEVILNIIKIYNNLNLCKKDLISFSPDCVIFIDYPGFNLRIANWAKAKGIDTHYYISPQIWAWKESRIKQIKNNIDHLHVILPFEKKFYEVKHQTPVNFVGHPLIDAIAEHTKFEKKSILKKFDLNEKPVIALLPGSRKQEINKSLKIMLSVIENFPNYQFVVAATENQPETFYQFLAKIKNLKFVTGSTYELLSVAKASVVMSGTATLESALFGVPQVVCYKSSWLSYQIGKRLIKLKHISLVNLIMEKEVVCELIQNDFNKKRLTRELKKILTDAEQKKIKADYKMLNQKLGGPGASRKTAELIFKSL